MLKSHLVSIVLLAIFFVLPACSSLNTTSTSFDLSYGEARDELRHMKNEPKPLERPLLYVGPYLDPGISQTYILNNVKKYIDDDRLLGVSFTVFDSFDSCRRKTIARVDKLYPSDDPLWTTEVDVISFSMGGLVSRYAAMPPDAERKQTRRLKINRLFTISTPNRGAQLAPLGAWASGLARDMQIESDFIARLTAAYPDAEYELIPYIRLGDLEVGPVNGAPDGQWPHWVSSRPIESPHVCAIGDARLRADIYRRLRGEPPLAKEPRAPLPGEDE